MKMVNMVIERELTVAVHVRLTNKGIVKLRIK